MYILYFSLSILLLCAGIISVPHDQKKKSKARPKSGDMRVMQDSDGFFIQRYHTYPSWEFWSPRNRYKTQQEARDFMQRLNQPDAVEVKESEVVP